MHASLDARSRSLKHVLLLDIDHAVHPGLLSPIVYMLEVGKAGSLDLSAFANYTCEPCTAAERPLA